MGKYVYDKDYFKTIDTEEKAYWLGFIYADGTITRFYKNNDTEKKEIRSMTLEIALQEGDKSHLEKFRDCLHSDVPIHEKTIRKKYKASRIRINCTSFCKDLIGLGCVPNKSLILEFPTDEIVPEHLLRHFIRGYFDGDGCIHYSENECYHKEREKSYLQYSFVASFTGNEQFLKELKKVLEQQNIKVSDLKFDKRSNAVNIYIHNGNDSLVKLYNYFYKDSNIFLDRKFEKYNDAFNKIELWKQNKK